MLTSLALIFLVGLAAASICQRIRLPRIIGMLATGILLGPYVLDFLDGSILSISSDLREMALVIILIKAGLSLDISELKEVGRPAVLMAFLPAVLKSCFCPAGARDPWRHFTGSRHPRRSAGSSFPGRGRA